MTIVVYTADLGAHDQTWEPADQDPPVRFVRFDSHAWPDVDTAWERRTAELHPPGLNDRLAARWYKTHPHVLFPDATFTIWVDACLEIVSPTFAADVVSAIESHHAADVAMFAHPDRDNVADELAAAETLPKYAGNRHAEMLADYTSALGVTPSPMVGLWAMTTIGRRNTQRARVVDAVVWAETLRWSTDEVTALDQLVYPYARAVVGAACPVDLAAVSGGTLWANDWFRRHDHRRET